jgi:nitroimidazol reductase NimA-like FMN-containing flavoprotein (pyridoxamine 5'-phosphate oxidase superfamily)
LREQAAKARGERKARLEGRMAELQAEQKRRSDLLKHAWELIKEALSA